MKTSNNHTFWDEDLEDQKLFAEDIEQRLDEIYEAQEKYKTKVLFTTINVVKPCKNGYEYLTDNGSFFSKYEQKDIQLGVRRGIVLRINKTTEDTFFLKQY